MVAAFLVARDDIRSTQGLEAAQTHAPTFILDPDLGHPRLDCNRFGLKQRCLRGNGAPGHQRLRRLRICRGQRNCIQA